MSGETLPTDSGAIPPHQPQVARPNTGELDTEFYTWTNLFKLIAGQGTAEERQRYLSARDIAREEADCKRCEKQRDWLFQHSPIINFMRDQINGLGTNVDINSTNARCRRCTTQQQGGFHRDFGILLCANYLPKKSMVEDALAHEMVHAYDHLRFDVQPENMAHQACTEIRASMLSGECRFTREFFQRGQMKLTRQFQECVRRRAVTSLMARPAINGDQKRAEREVDGVWGSCFQDTRPFDDIFR